MCHPQSSSHPVNLILEQQTQLSIAGAGAGIAVLPKEAGKRPRWRRGRRAAESLAKGKVEADGSGKDLVGTAACCSDSRGSAGFGLLQGLNPATREVPEVPPRWHLEVRAPC